MGSQNQEQAVCGIGLRSVTRRPDKGQRSPWEPLNINGQFNKVQVRLINGIERNPAQIGAGMVPRFRAPGCE
jgi:hypothetical protein